MENKVPEVDLAVLFSVIYKRRIIVFVCVACFLVVGSVIAIKSPIDYEATITIGIAKTQIDSLKMVQKIKAGGFTYNLQKVLNLTPAIPVNIIASYHDDLTAIKAKMKVTGQDQQQALNILAQLYQEIDNENKENIRIKRIKEGHKYKDEVDRENVKIERSNNVRELQGRIITLDIDTLESKIKTQEAILQEINEKLANLMEAYEAKREEYEDSVKKMEQITAKNDNINIGLANLYTNINSQKYDQMKDLKTAMLRFEKEEDEIKLIIQTAKMDIERKRLQKKILELEKEKQITEIIGNETENTDDVILLQEPAVSLTETKKKQIILIFGLLGIIFGVIISFAMEFYLKIRAKI